MTKRPRASVAGVLLLCLMSASAGTASVRPSQRPSDEPVPLAVGTPVERELRGGEEHRYAVRLDVGQYLYAVIEQKGVDVVVTLTDPGGAAVGEVDSPNGAQGPEPVYYVAETAGVYRLDVRSRDTKAPAGRYEVMVVEARAATARDRPLAEARTLDGRSRVASALGERDDAIALAERALSLYENAFGPDHVDLTASIERLATLYTGQAEYAKAEALYIRETAIYEKANGPDHPFVAACLNNRAELYIRQGQYAKAEPLFERAIAIFERSLGPDHPDLAGTLHNVAALYYAQGQYAKAEPLFLRAIAIYERAPGPMRPSLAASLDYLGVLYSGQGQYANAEPLFLRAIEIYEKLLGPENADLAATLDNLAGLYSARGQYAKAEPLNLRALAIKEKALGPDHPNLATTLHNLAGRYREQGQYAKAEALFERAVAIYEKALGPDHPDLAIGLESFAGLYRAKGEYAKAEPLYTRALAIKEKAYGPEHPSVALTLNNLALLFNSQGRYAKAEPLYTRALAIYEKVRGPEHPMVAGTLNNLAKLYSNAGQLAKADPLYVRALAIYEKALGPEHPNVAIVLHNLAKNYKDEGQYAKAEPLYLRALAIREKAFGPEHPDVAASLHNLAGLYAAEGENAKAGPLYVRAIAIREKVLGPEHPDLAESLNRAALVSFASADLNEALRLQTRAGDVREGELRRNLVAGSEAAKRQYLAQTTSETDTALSIQAACGPENGAALRMALTQILRRKGRAMDALVDQLDALARSGSVDDGRLLADLARARADLAALTLRGAGKEGVEQHQRDLAEAASRVDELEAQAGARSARLRTELMPITLDGVRAAVPSGATLVEFATYRPYDPKARATGPMLYVVYTLTADGTLRWASLGDAESIDAAVAGLRDALRTRADLDATLRPRARALDALVFAPVRKLVGASTRLLIAPDGQLSLVPFDALVDERGRFETEVFEISYLTSGRDLLRLGASAPGAGPPTVFADPDFGGATRSADERKLVVEEAGPGQSGAPLPSLLARAYFAPLRGTAREARALGRLLPSARVLTRVEATKRAFVSLSAPRVLHVATHGFFLASAPAPPPVSGEAPTEDPMLRSGLAFAGANLHEGGSGIVTALEVAGMDLWGTKLVVLSACDTGVGEVRNGDGVYGLRRALVLAGSETQVMSLWPVSDEGTRDLMIAYYSRLRDGAGRSAALRAVRLAMLGDPKRRHPYYWASFIVSGEWAGLDGKRP